MKKYFAIVILLAFTTIVISSISYAQSMESDKIRKMDTTKAKIDLRLAMRKLWENNVTYTRNYITSLLSDSKDTDAIVQILLKNQDDIGNVITQYYGEDAGKKLSTLLRDNILITTKVVQLIKITNAGKLDEKWHANADDIAAFLSNVNSNWSKKDLTEMLYKYLELTSANTFAHLKKNQTADIELYDKCQFHILMFADILTDGIVKQFPEKFKK